MSAIKFLAGTAAVLVALSVIGIGVWVYLVQNVETPEYTVVRSAGAIEVRDYPALVVAEVTRRGERKSAVSAGFSPLASYIFAKDRGGEGIAMTAPVTQSRENRNEKIAMTAPVTQTAAAEDAPDSDEQSWQVRFIMPKKYDLAELPKPSATSGVTLKRVEASRKAAIRFSGVATDDLIARNEARLKSWLAENNLKPSGPPTYAYYNDPFTPGALRRNEVIFDLE